jgi:hypothetical protein
MGRLQYNEAGPARIPTASGHVSRQAQRCAVPVRAMTAGALALSILALTPGHGRAANQCAGYPSTASYPCNALLDGYWSDAGRQVYFHPDFMTGSGLGDITKLGDQPCPTSLSGGAQNWIAIVPAGSSGLDYTGLAKYVHADCTPDSEITGSPYGNATFTIDQPNPAQTQHLTICSVPPGDTSPPQPGSGDTSCSTYVRLPAIVSSAGIFKHAGYAVLHRHVGLPFSCPAEAATVCAGTIKLLHGGHTIIFGKYDLQPGQGRTIRLGLTKTAINLLGGGKQFPAWLEIQSFGFSVNQQGGQTQRKLLRVRGEDNGKKLVLHRI